MTDIVEWLRKDVENVRAKVAADEIETLSQRVQDSEETINTYVDLLNERDAALISMADKCTACGKELTAERAISDKLEKSLTGVQSEFYQYTEGFTVLWDEIDATLAELAAMRKGETE